MRRLVTIGAGLALAASLGTAQSSTAALKKKLDAVRKETKGVRTELREKKVEVWIAAEEIRVLDDRASAAEAKLDDTRAQLRKDKEKQKDLAAQLARAESELGVQRRVVAKRIRAMYMSADSDPLSVLLGSRDFSDFAARQSLLERIAKFDRVAFDRLRALKAKVAADKLAQDQAVARVAGLERVRAAQQRELESALRVKAQLLARLRRERSALERELDAMEAASDRIAAEILARQGGGGVPARFSGRFLSPASGRVASGFGYRIHPITRTRRMHSGVDIAAPTGTPIRAAAAGVVITAGWMNGYGNTVVIDHGGGISTLYGHCSRLFVSSGQRVAAGQRIAAVGSTGFSTGPHLHFEKRVNGRPVNPRG